MLCAVQRHPLPGQVCGVCAGHGEKEVKPVGLTVFRKETDKVSDFKILLFFFFGSFTDSSTTYLKGKWSWWDEAVYGFFSLIFICFFFFFLYPLLFISFFFVYFLCFKCRSESVVKTRRPGRKGKQENAALSRQVQGTHTRLQQETKGVYWPHWSSLSVGRETEQLVSVAWLRDRERVVASPLKWGKEIVSGIWDPKWEVGSLDLQLSCLENLALSQIHTR